MSVYKLKDLMAAYIEILVNSEYGMPNGHLYALIAIRTGFSLEEHLDAVRALKQSGMVAEHGQLLTWAGTKEQRAQVLAAFAEAPKAPAKEPPLRLICCVCGDAAPAHKQWWNHDTGFGICPTCYARQLAKEGQEAAEHCYGLPNVHHSLVD
jgi:hypothetical protein